MHTRTFVFGIVLVLAGAAAWAQHRPAAQAPEAPAVELSFDYSFARYAPSASYTQGHSLNGGGGRVVYNLADWLGVGMDLQGYNSNTNRFTIPPSTYFPRGAKGTASGNLFTYLFGPVFKYRWEGVGYFGDVLFGAAHSSVYGNAYKEICTPVAGRCAFSSSPNGDAFAMSAGGGLDIPINRRVEFRAGEFDYLYTRFTNQFTNAGQNNFRFLTGVNIHIGYPTSSRVDYRAARSGGR